MTTSSLFTVTNLTAATSEALYGAGFREVSTAALDDWRAAVVRLYEDEYSIVCVAIYETWADLDTHWMLDQANLIDLMSRNIVRNDPKAWEGYLVLLTPSIVPSPEREKAILIQRDTRHVRKLFAHGGELKEIDDVTRLLLPLMPLEERGALLSQNILDALPEMLSQHGVDKEIAQVVIAAFRAQRPIIPEVHALILERRGQQA